MKVENIDFKQKTLIKLSSSQALLIGGRYIKPFSFYTSVEYENDDGFISVIKHTMKRCFAEHQEKLQTKSMYYEICGDIAGKTELK